MGKDKIYLGDDNKPVAEVNWYEAVKFCDKLSQKDQREYSLPTEAQWEYACRAGSTTKFYFGDNDSDLDYYGWFEGNSHCNKHPVGQKKPNAFGLYDMHGNVSEWCKDWYSEDYYSNSPNIDPTGPAYGTFRVCRGLMTAPEYYRSAQRNFINPDTHDGILGFRVVLDFYPLSQRSEDRNSSEEKLNAVFI